MERLSWLDSYGRVTQRYADWLEKYGLITDIKNLSTVEQIGYSTVERIVKNKNHSYLFPNKENFPVNAGIDEFAQRKGRGNFCVLITNNDEHKPFDILPSKKLQFAFECSKGIKEMYELKEDIRAVFEKKIKKEKKWISKEKKCRTPAERVKIKIDLGDKFQLLNLIKKSYVED